MPQTENTDSLKLQITIWEKVIDVQMHFNDMCLRIRSFAVSILGVLLGASAIAYRFAGKIEVFTYIVPTATIFIGISIIAWLAFYLMDRYWYHELLKGAVHHAKKIEDSLEINFPEITLSHSIREQSHKSLKMNAAKKLHIFYISILLVQVTAFFVLASGFIKIST